MLGPQVMGARRLKMSSTVNIVWDGNSLVAGAGADNTTRCSAQVANLPPVAGSGAATANIGVSGQTWRQMNGLDSGLTTDVESAWISGKKNVLICWETRNSIFTGRTWQQAVQDGIDYIAARRLSKVWHSVILINCLPSYALDGKAEALDSANAYMAANFRAMGADILIDVQTPGSPFRFTGNSMLPFQLTQSLWAETSNWTHLNAAGYAIVAGLVAGALRRLPA
jgi:hypothetical protein